MYAIGGAKKTAQLPNIPSFGVPAAEEEILVYVWGNNKASGPRLG